MREIKICTECKVNDAVVSRGTCKDCFNTMQRERYWAKKLSDPDYQPPQVHAITNVDPDKGLADCRMCGPGTPVVRYGNTPAWRCVAAQKEQKRNNRLKRMYKIDTVEYNRRFEEQDGKCFLCHREDVELVVDHDHRCCPTAKTCGNCLRKLICNPCNGMVGHIEHKGIKLEALLSYMESEN